MTEYTGRILSRHLGNERSVWVRPPRDLHSTNLVIFLDAELYRERVRAADIVQSMSGSKQIDDAWFVFVSMHSIEARWTECPCHLPFAKFIGEELLGWLSDWLPESRSAISRTIVGLSYTGLAAAYVALIFPGLFRSVIAQSGSFWWREGWLVESYASDRHTLATEFYLEVGTREVQQNVRHREDVLQVISQIDGVRRFRDVLRRRGVSVRYSEYDGGHDFTSWAVTLPQALRWALPNRDLEPGAAGTPTREAGPKFASDSSLQVRK